MSIRAQRIVSLFSLCDSQHMLTLYCIPYYRNGYYATRKRRIANKLVAFP